MSILCAKVDIVLKKVYYKIKNHFEKRKIIKNWKLANKHNFTVLKSLSAATYVKVGNFTYGEINVCCYGRKDFPVLKIGNFCSLAKQVMFLLKSEHGTSYVSSYPFITKLGLDDEFDETLSKGDICVDDDVWIGYGATIMSGVHIG